PEFGVPMAWIVKPSATTKIPTRKEPYLTPAMTEHYRQEILPRYQTTMGALMPILHDVQHHYGHIPYQAMIEIAKFLAITPGEVLGHIVKAVKSDPKNKKVVRTKTEESRREDGVILRRTTIEEIELSRDNEPHQ